MVSTRGGVSSDFDVERGAASVYVVIDNPDEVWARVEQIGATVVRPMEDTDYGSRGFSIKDPEGNRWSFGTYGG